MNRFSRSIVSTFVALLLSAAVLQAEPPARGFYGKVDGGGVITSTTDVEEIFGPVFPGTEVEFNPGARFGMGFGYHFTEWFATEFEIGMNFNEIDSITGAQHVDAWLYNVPMLVNVRLELPNRSLIRPYIGGGVGGAFSTIDIDNLIYANRQLWGSASDAVFAWQGFAGVRFLINDQMSAGVEYRYVFSESPNFDIDYGYYWNIYNDKMSFDDLESHVFSLMFQYEF